MSASSSLKGKGRAPDRGPAHLHQSQSPPARSKPAFRHGRGPIIPDDDDEHEPATGTLIVNRESEGDDERTSLLYSTSGGADRSVESLAPRPARRRPGWRTCALVGALAVGFVVLLLLALVHLWVGHVVSEQGKKGGLEEMIRRGLRVEGPFEVGVAEGQGENEVVLKVNASVGFDARSGLGWEDKDTKQASILNEWESYFARLAVKTTDSVQLNLDSLLVFTEGPDGQEYSLLEVPSLESVRVPVSYPHGAQVARTTPLALSVPLRFPDPDAAAKFAARVWNTKKYAVQARVDGVHVRAGRAGQKGLSEWVMRTFGQRRMDRVQQPVAGSRESSLRPHRPPKWQPLTLT